MQDLLIDRNIIAYFSMEIGIDEKIHTYSGGLGILAGDTIRSSADLKVPMVAISLLYRKGHFHQKLEKNGLQREGPDPWPVKEFMQEMSARTHVIIHGRTVHLRAWKYEVKGITGLVVPVYFLDADLPENSEWDRTLTHHLYGGDNYYRLCQEVILGVGGARMLKELGYNNIRSFHMNEGHSALLTMELLDDEAKKAGRNHVTEEDCKKVHKKCVFTTHTIVPAAHDKFTREMAEMIIGKRDDFFGLDGVLYNGTVLNMTYLALKMSRYVNGVAKSHGEISRELFSGYSINSITNGVHAGTWVSDPFRELFNKHIPMWQNDNFSLRYALSIPKDDIWEAHMLAKRKLIDHVNKETRLYMDENVLTIGFARRAAAYKRADLLFHDIERLRTISNNIGKIQVIFSGKAHPADNGGKNLIKRIFDAKNALSNDIEIVYLENYNMNLGAMITSGVDIWLNTPEPPKEASGTSGMKAALNGVPNLSVLDGWWIEGNIEGVTGWSIGNGALADEKNKNLLDARSMYDKLENIILPLYYHDRNSFIDVMRNSIAINGSFFNTHRMIQEYVLNAYCCY
ncbi:MAG: alpha-glucan family phosphorylase [Methanolobus sp.]|nr:alpha-glucan family phosphorylase [Methanolobus sp.]